MSHQFLVVGKERDLIIDLKFPTELDSEYELGLLCFSVYNITFNVTISNNKFIVNSKEDKLEPGAYETKEISEKLKSKHGIEVIPDTSTAKCNLSNKLKKECKHSIYF